MKKKVGNSTSETAGGRHQRVIATRVARSKTYESLRLNLIGLCHAGKVASAGRLAMTSGMSSSHQRLILQTFDEVVTELRADRAGDLPDLESESCGLERSNHLPLTERA